jgi:hypothetical protein
LLESRISIPFHFLLKECHNDLLASWPYFFSLSPFPSDVLFNRAFCVYNMLLKETSHTDYSQAIGAGGLGAAGLAEHEHHKHQQQQTGVIPDAHNSSYDHATGKQHVRHPAKDAELGAGAAGAHEHHQKHHERQLHHQEKQHRVGIVPGTSNVPYDQTTDQKHDHHLGRDAAIGTGLVGAGAAVHEHDKKREETTDEGTPQKKSLLQKILHPGKNKDTEDTPTEHDSSHQDKHHLGRDTTLGAGAVGAGGLAAHEHQKHKEEKETTSAQQIDPSHQDRHHLGRDTALGAGAVGAGGLAAHEHENRQDPAAQPTKPQQKGGHSILRQIFNPNNDKYDQTVYGQPVTTSIGQQGPSTMQQVSHIDPNNASGAQISQPTDQHHYGRDTAVAAGGLGAVGLAEHEHHKKEDNVAVGNQPVASEPAAATHAAYQDSAATGAGVGSGKGVASGMGAGPTTGGVVGAAGERTQPGNQGVGTIDQGELPPVPATGGKFMDRDINTIPSG